MHRLKDKDWDNKTAFCSGCEALVATRVAKKNGNPFMVCLPHLTELKKKSYKKNYVRVTYSLTPEKFQAMLEQQNNACALCEVTFTKTPHVDHDHSCCAGGKSCGKCVRGLLCKVCNTLVGKLERNNMLEKITNYTMSL